MDGVAARCRDCGVPYTYNFACQACRVRKLEATRCRRHRQLMQADFVKQWGHKTVRIKGGCECEGPARCPWRRRPE